MNIENRTGLYTGVRRILAREGRLATYDLVLRDGDVMYPVPWARDASASFLLTESDTRTALEEAGYRTVFWRDDTKVALDWFKTAIGTQPQSGPNLALVMGADFAAMTGNLARNLREKRFGRALGSFDTRLRLSCEVPKTCRTALPIPCVQVRGDYVRVCDR